MAVENEEVTEDEIVETVVVDPEQAQYEERARRQGWRPKEEYAGDPSRWVDAKTFVEKGEAVLPVLRERFHKMEERATATDRELRETRKQLEDTTRVIVELRDMSRVAEERAYARAARDLESREREAVREASEEKFDLLRREREALEQSRPKPPPVAAAAPTPPSPPAPTSNPIVDSWISENPWFQSDPVLNSLAIDEDRQVKASHPDWSVQEQLAEVKRRVVDRFPEKFGNTRRKAPPPVSTSSAPAPRPTGKTVKDLPPEAKAALARFKNSIPGYKDEDYLKVYFAGVE